jgi:outer membrane protein assembly factor BamB
MSASNGKGARPMLGRRAALLLPLAAGGCSFFDDLFQTTKPKIPGKREPVLAAARGLERDRTGDLRVALPPAVRNADWPQAGGNPAHLMGHLATGDRLAQAWSADIGEGGGYRRKILAQPVKAGGLVYAMDSDGLVSAFDARTGERQWRTDTRDEDDESTNIGGGIAVDNGVLYAVNGVAWLVAMDARTGTIKYRKGVGAPTRSAPTIADGRIFFTTIEDRLLAHAVDDGRQLWTHQAQQAQTTLLGQPAPTYANGLVIGAFGSGEIVAVRAETGGVAWTDSIGSVRGRDSLADVAAIRGLPVIQEGRVFAIGLGGLTISSDQRSGRRLWERDVGGEDSLWVAGDWVFLISVRQQIAALNRNDGRVAWVNDLPRYEDEEKQDGPIQWFGPLLAGDRLIVAGTNSQALAVSPYTGEIIGRQELSGAASLGPVLADGTVYIVTDDGHLVALR